MSSSQPPPAVPKFSSFKRAPKELQSTKPPPTPTESASATADRLRRDKRKEDDASDRKKRRHRDHDRHHAHSRSRSPAGHRDKQRRTVSPTPPPPMAVDTGLYKIDTKGDSSNITYGTIYRYSVPLFYRFGAGYILGLSNQWRIDREKPEGKGLVVGMRGKDVDKRRKGRNMFAVDSSRVGRLKANDDVEKGFGPNDEFVAIMDSNQKHVHDKIDERDYRSIEGKPKMTTSEDIESISSEDEGTFSYSEELKQRTITLDRKLQSHPHDIESWLQYVALQDEIGFGSKGSTAEIKLGILQKGLEKNPGNTKLLLEILKIEGLLHEPARVHAHWEELLRKYENPELIVEYLNHRQSTFVSFTYPEIVSAYSQCLASLRRLAWKAIPSEKQDRERTILYILQRFATMAREAGYIELGIACFQALIELNLFRPLNPPPTDEKSRDSELERFEEFWDSECPRFGEAGAKGWKAFDPDDIVEVPATVDIEAGTSIDEWVEREERSKMDMPARTTDETSQDDPYRVILFKDIRPFLYVFTTDVIRQVPYTFLSFCGINIPSPEMSSNDSILTDPWLRNQFDMRGFWPRPADVRLISWINGEVVEPERLPGIEGPFTFRRKVWPLDIDTLFSEQGNWFTRLDDSDFQSVNKTFVTTALNQLKPVIQDEWIMTIHLAIENSLTPESALKLAKSYLKARKTSTLLWNVYALLLWRRKCHDEARKVWKTAIEMTFSTRADPIVLWRTWIMAEVEENVSRARTVLSLLSADSPKFDKGEIWSVGGAGELKTRKYLQDQYDRNMSFKAWAGVEFFAVLIVLHRYFSSGLEGALSKYDEIRESLISRAIASTPTHERILLSISRILFQHTRVEGWYRASSLRDFWAEAIREFPYNTAFLSLFAWNEANARIDGRVRKLCTELEKHPRTNTWIFSIWTEVSLERGRISEFTVRPLFEKAVGAVSSSIVIWMLFIQFEARYGKPRLAKELVLRAIRECPWAKEPAMLALSVLRDLFTQAELARVYNVMVEKEIRIHGELSGMDDVIPTEVGGQITLPVDQESDQD